MEISSLKTFNMDDSLHGEVRKTGEKVRGIVADVDSLVKEHLKDRTNTLVYFGAGLLGIAGIMGFIRYKVPVNLSTKVVYASMAVFGTTACGFSLYNRYQSAKIINKKIQEVLDLAGKQFAVSTTSAQQWPGIDKDITFREEETSYSKEALKRMMPYCEYDGMQYTITRDFKVTWEPKWASLFSAKPISMSTEELRNDLDELKARRNPWRQLLNDLTLPSNKDHVTEAERWAVAGMAASQGWGELFAKIINFDKEWRYTHGAQLNVVGFNRVVYECKTAQAFKDYLERAFGFTIDSAPKE